MSPHVNAAVPGCLYSFDKLPFLPKNVFWVESSEPTKRGGHAHRSQDQILAVQKGHVRVVLDFQQSHYEYDLVPGEWLHVPPMHMLDYTMSANSILLVMASAEFEAKDYVKKIDYFQHHTAIVESAHIGERTRIWAWVNIRPGAVIGVNCNICDHCFVEDEVTLGDNVTLKTCVSVWNGTVLEDDVFVGPNVVFTNDRNPRSKNFDSPKFVTTVKRGASIGANATIMPGITVGEYAMVGSGSVVTKDVPSHALVYGNPARIHGNVNRRGIRIPAA